MQNVENIINLKKLAVRLYSQMPLIGVLWRRSAAEKLALDGSPEAVYILAEAVTRSDDERVRSIAMEALRQLTDRHCIDTVCSVWAGTRHAALSTLLTEKSWVASNPVDVKVLSAIKAGQIDAVLGGNADIAEPLMNVCRDADPDIARRARTCLVGIRNAEIIDKLYKNPEVVEPLIQACHDSIPEVARQARKCLLQLQHPKVIEVFYKRLDNAIEPLAQACEDDDHAVAERACSTIKELVNNPRKGLLYRLVIEHGYPTAGEIVAAEGGAEFVNVLLDACENADSPIVGRTRMLLGQLKKSEAHEELCYQLIKHDYPLAREVAVAAQYAPRDPNQRALFYFVTEQWEKYESLDFDQTLLKAEYEAADDSLKKRISEIAKRAGRVEWAEIIVGRQWENFTDEEWETILAVLERNKRWERIWRLAQEAPVIWSVKFLQRLKKIGWTPNNADEQKGFLELIHLSGQCRENTLKSFDLPDNPVLEKFPITSERSKSQQFFLEISPEAVRCLTVSLDGRLLASAKGQTDKTVKLWRLSDGKLAKTLAEHPAAVTCLTISPDGQFLVSGSLHRITLWRLPEGEELKILRGHTNWLRSLVISPDGRKLISGSQDMTIRIWELPGGQLLNILEGHTDWVNCLVLSPGGKLLASGSDDCTIRLWRLSDGRHLKTLDGHTGHVERLAISPGGNVLVSGSDDGVRLWQLPDGNLLKTLPKHPNWLSSYSVSPEGWLLAQWSSEKTVRLWRLDPSFLVKYLSLKQIPLQDIMWISGWFEWLQNSEISGIEQNWLKFTLALIHWNRRFDIEVEEVPRGIPLGEFDIEIDA